MIIHTMETCALANYTDEELITHVKTTRADDWLSNLLADRLAYAIDTLVEAEKEFTAALMDGA